MTSNLDHNRSGQLFAAAIIAVAAMLLGINYASAAGQFIINHFFTFQPARTNQP
jgi:hypothetical protein